MDKKFLKENNLFESQKKFQQLCEYTFIGADELRNEAEDDDMENSDELSQEDMPEMGDNGNESEVQPDFSMNDGENMDANGGVEGFNPEDESEINNNGDMSSEEDEEVIDVDDLTTAQEETNTKVDDLKVDFSKLNGLLDKIEKYIEQNNQNIDSLKAEIEKRNPTEVEKLSLRAKDSYPFNVTPEEYWAQKEATSNYRTDNDENGEKQGQYVITKNDIDGMTDWKAISDSLNDDDLNQTLSKVLGY